MKIRMPDNFKCLTVLEVLANMTGQEKEVRNENWETGHKIIIVCKLHNWKLKRINGKSITKVRNFSKVAEYEIQI